MEVTVIDQSDIVGWLAAFTRTGEIPMTNVNSMVRNVLRAAGSNRISRLNILDHGNRNGLEIGSDFLTIGTIARFGGTLRRLSDRFTTDGFVHLQHCEVGQNRALMVAFARLVGARVFAGTGKHNPIYRINFGDYVEARPDGTFRRKVGRP